MKGKLITFEGIDGSGKATQTRLLLDRLMSLDIPVTKIDFPRHGEMPAWFVDEYLNGRFGKADEVKPKVASLFYACDRYDASFDMKDNLNKGVWIVGDRYVGSNVGHQGSKFETKEERKEFIRWLFELEYGLLELPRPDLTIILKTPARASGQRTLIQVDEEKIKRRDSYLKDKNQDIHEEDVSHLERARQAYIDAAELFPDDFTILDCMEGDKMLGPNTIHDKVWEIIKDRFNL